MKTSKKRPSIATASKRKPKSSAAIIGEQLAAEAMGAAARAPGTVQHFTAPAERPSTTTEQLIGIGAQLAARLAGIEEALARLVSHVEQAPVKAPRKAKAAPAEAPPAEPPAAEDEAPSNALACCGAAVSSGIHKSTCPVKYPPVVSYDDLRASAVAFASSNGKDALVAHIQKFAPTGKLGEVAEADRAALLAVLKAGA